MVIKTGVPTPGDLRALTARKKVLLYMIAPEMGMTPTQIGRMLNGHVPMSDEVALRLLACLERARESN